MMSHLGRPAPGLYRRDRGRHRCVCARAYVCVPAPELPVFQVKSGRWCEGPRIDATAMRREKEGEPSLFFFFFGFLFSCGSVSRLSESCGFKKKGIERTLLRYQQFLADRAFQAISTRRILAGGFRRAPTSELTPLDPFPMSP